MFLLRIQDNIERNIYGVRDFQPFCQLNALKIFFKPSLKVYLYCCLQWQTSSVMFTLRNKTAKTILFWSQCCYLTEEIGKDKQKQTQKRVRTPASCKLGFLICVSPGCPQHRASHSPALNKHWLNRRTGAQEGEGKTHSPLLLLYLLCVLRHPGIKTGRYEVVTQNDK